MVRRKLKSWAGAAMGLALAVSGCSFSFQKLEYERAIQELDNNNPQAAVAHFEKLIKRSPGTELSVESARRASRIAHLEIKNYKLALEFYRHLVLHSTSQDERMSAQRMIADIYFENILDFDKAIIEYSKLLKLPHTPEEDFRYRFNMAKSYYQLNNFSQAQFEVEDLLSKSLSNDKRFELMVFKASLLETMKSLDEAAKMFAEIIQKFPERAQKESIALNLAVCFEEKGDFKKAIEILEEAKKDYPTPEFVEFKIKRLRSRMENQPGAGGFKK